MKHESLLTVLLAYNEIEWQLLLFTVFCIIIFEFLKKKFSKIDGNIIESSYVFRLNPKKKREGNGYSRKKGR